VVNCSQRSVGQEVDAHERFCRSHHSNRRVVGRHRVARELFKEYGASLGFPLCFQNFEEELPHCRQVRSPRAVMLAFIDGAPVGCGALRLRSARCEMKRLYVRPKYKGQGIGRKLAERLITEAKQIGYNTNALDTIPAEMMEATDCTCR